MEPEKIESIGEAHTTHGFILKFKLPSGKNCTIRDRNGDDEDILSRMGDATTGEGMYNFLSSILLEHDDFKDKPITPDDVAKFKSRDLYYILFKSRVLTFGYELEFEYTWEGTNSPTSYIEDLEKYDWDLNNPLPKKKERDYFKHRIKPYLNEDEKAREFKLTTGKQVRYNHLTGEAETNLLEVKQDDITVNTEIKFRGLEIKREDSADGWQQVNNFKGFTSREMMEIRKDIKKYDSTFSVVSDLPNPKTKVVQQIQLIMQPAFLFPEDL